MNNQEILAIVPARAGSKGIPNKNTYILNGKPLLSYTVDEIKKSTMLNRAILTTDSKEIAILGKTLGLEVPFLRSKKLAKDDTPTLPVIQNAIELLYKNENYKPDIIVILQPTSPLRKAKHIDESIKKFLRNSVDSLVSVVRVPHNMSPSSAMILEQNDLLKPFMKIDEKNNIRQKKPKFYARNGAAIYICSYNCIKYKNSLYGDQTIAYVMDKEDSFDIDDFVDLDIVRNIIKNK